MTARPRTARRLTLAAALTASLGLTLAAQAGPPPPSEAAADGLPAWLDAALAAEPDHGAARAEAPDAEAALTAVRGERRPRWSITPRARLGYAGDWSAHTDLRLEVPIVEPSVARRERAAERRLRAARRNDRLARRDRARALLDGAAQWWRAHHTLTVLDAALQRAQAWPPPTGEVATELAAWRRLRDEVALDRRLLRRHLAQHLGRDPDQLAPPDPTGAAAYDALRAPLRRLHLPACVDRDANVVRARGALADARAAARDPAGGAQRVHLAVGANVGVDRGSAHAAAPQAPNLTAGARVQLEVGWPMSAPVNGSVRTAVAHDGVRLEARVAGPAWPEPPRDERDAARGRLEEAVFEAEARLRRAHLAWRQLDRHLARNLARATDARASTSASSPEGLRAAVAAAPDLPALLAELDAAVARLDQRARAARLAGQLAVACEPAVSSGSWSASRTPPGAATPPSTRSSSAPASPD